MLSSVSFAFADWLAFQRSSYVGDDWMADLALQAGITADGGAKEKVERDILFVGELSDELTVAIALKEWGKAVKLVDEG